MDEIVLRAMAKWPNVPAVYGWLSLDRRGRWYIKDDLIANDTITGFIARNYSRDDRGCWYFQNGPQRVFVECDYLPIVLAVTARGLLTTHTHHAVRQVSAGFVDEEGSLILTTEHGPALLDDRDTDTLTQWLADSQGAPLDEDSALVRIEQLQQGEQQPITLIYGGRAVPLEPIRSGDIESRMGFIRVPMPSGGQPACQ
jgi:hypothetical protein